MPTPTVSIFEASDYDAQVARAAGLLRDGSLVVLPTETVYGAAAVLTHSQALARLRALRPEATPAPLTIHVAHATGARDYLGPVTELGQRMMRKLWPGPVALVFDVPADRRREVAAKLGIDEREIYDRDRITLRCPDHVVTTDVIAQAAAPVVLVRTGAAQPALRAEQAASDLDGKVALVLDAGPTRFSKPSTIVRVKPEGGYEITRIGVYDERIIQRLLRTTILFVCSGNTCRSPMAEGLARKVLGKKLKVSETELEHKGITVTSAGSMAFPGGRATPQAVEAARLLGVDIGRHRSKPLSVELIHQADMIFTMGRAHAAAVTALVPSAADKVSTLAPGRDIDDPIGGDVDLYRELAGELEMLIEQRLRDTALP